MDHLTIDGVADDIGARMDALERRMDALLQRSMPQPTPEPPAAETPPNYQWDQFFYCEILRQRFNALECRAIIDFHLELPAHQSVLHRSAEHKVRDSGIYWLYSNSATAWVFDRINAAVNEYNARYQYEILPIHSAQLTRYEANQFYDWHVDIGERDMSLRKISVSVQLSDSADYTGGGLIVGKDAQHLERGDMALFPSMMLHQAPVITSGERWSLVCWILGERPLR